MSSGVIPHFHPSTIEYRDKPYKDNIYLRKYFSFSYKPDKQRVTETEEAYKSSHLESEKYFKLRPDYLRESGYSFRPDNRFK
jgi:outer membrane lipoprotein-sorting protein